MYSAAIIDYMAEHKNILFYSIDMCVIFKIIYLLNKVRFWRTIRPKFLDSVNSEKNHCRISTLSSLSSLSHSTADDTQCVESIVL